MMIRNMTRVNKLFNSKNILFNNMIINWQYNKINTEEGEKWNKKSSRYNKEKYHVEKKKKKRYLIDQRVLFDNIFRYRGTTLRNLSNYNTEDFSLKHNSYRPLQNATRYEFNEKEWLLIKTSQICNRHDILDIFKNYNIDENKIICERPLPNFERTGFWLVKFKSEDEKKECKDKIFQSKNLFFDDIKIKIYNLDNESLIQRSKDIFESDFSHNSNRKILMRQVNMKCDIDDFIQSFQKFNIQNVTILYAKHDDIQQPLKGVLEFDGEENALNFLIENNTKPMFDTVTNFDLELIQ
eukprot:TRINITY_DN5506_c0_g2_i1.p1 TRINITY_DN5506_c0_g2~~TRINITY_DN5506_c0_g2_i1.p1  ORF type:complete len:303 (-),score=57.72 TRINITY_DN5506_c0_g2_i1:57-944(-)